MLLVLPPVLGLILQAQAVPRRGGILRVAAGGEPLTLDTIATTNHLAATIMLPVRESLFAFDAGWRIQPLLMDAYAQSFEFFEGFRGLFDNRLSGLPQPLCIHSQRDPRYLSFGYASILPFSYDEVKSYLGERSMAEKQVEAILDLLTWDSGDLIIQTPWQARWLADGCQLRGCLRW